MPDHNDAALLAEHQTVQDLLEHLPAEHVLDRASLLVRLAQIEALLTERKHSNNAPPPPDTNS